MSEHISSHQLNTWIRCPKQYEFRYLLGYKLPPSGFIARGSACHKAWEMDHRHKMTTEENLAKEIVVDVYSDEFDRRSGETEWIPEEDKGQMKDIGVKMVESYYENVSRKVQPISCEEPFEIVIRNHIVKGVIDLETKEKEVREAKTTSRKKSEIPVDHQLQMAIYSRAKPEASRFILDNTIAQSKNVELETLTLKRSDLPQRKLDAYLDSFGESLQKGHFPPTHPSNWWCSQKWCGFYKICKFGLGDR